MLASALEKDLIDDAIIAKNETESERFWRIRHSISEAQKSEGASLKHDIAVPVGRIAEFISASEHLIQSMIPDARLVTFGHVGDGNLHFNIAQAIDGDADTFRKEGEALTDAIYDLVADMGGSFSAEHGIGVFKKHYLERYRGGTELELMRALKGTMDPGNTLNPGKVI